LRRHSGGSQVRHSTDRRVTASRVSVTSMATNTRRLAIRIGLASTAGTVVFYTCIAAETFLSGCGDGLLDYGRGLLLSPLDVALRCAWRAAGLYKPELRAFASQDDGSGGAAAPFRTVEFQSVGVLPSTIRLVNVCLIQAAHFIPASLAAMGAYLIVLRGRTRNGHERGHASALRQATGPPRFRWRKSLHAAAACGAFVCIGLGTAQLKRVASGERSLREPWTQSLRLVDNEGQVTVLEYELTFAALRGASRRATVDCVWLLPGLAVVFIICGRCPQSKLDIGMPGCPRCGYTVAGLPEARCPECGVVLPRARRMVPVPPK
jgi:hypothetical protein